MLFNLFLLENQQLLKRSSDILLELCFNRFDFLIEAPQIFTVLAELIAVAAFLLFNKLTEVQRLLPNSHARVSENYSPKLVLENI